MFHCRVKTPFSDYFYVLCKMHAKSRKMLHKYVNLSKIFL